MKGGGSPHAYALKPSDARALAKARAVFWIGPALEGFLVKPLMGLTRTVFTVELAGAEGVVTRRSESGKEPDPHIWLDPANAAQMVKTMVIVLANIDPANAVLYRRNGSGLLAGLAALDGEIRQVLAPVKDKAFMVYHDAYGHFERRFGLKGAGAVSVGRRPAVRSLSVSPCVNPVPSVSEIQHGALACSPLTVGSQQFNRAGEVGRSRDESQSGPVCLR